MRLAALLYEALHFALYTVEAVVLRITGTTHESSLKERLKGNYSPTDPTDCFEGNLKITEGTLPKDITSGMYVRNGPNPLYVPRNGLYHWFDGDGMLQGIRILPNRQVNYVRHQLQTKRLLLEKAVKHPVFVRVGELGGIFALFKLFVFNLGTWINAWGTKLTPEKSGLENGTANTSVVFWSRQLWALHEGSYPFAVRVFLDGLMESIGYNELQGKLKRPFTAHPKIDPESKKLYMISPNIFDKKCLFTYSIIDERGNVEKTLNLGMKRATFMHDFAITKNFAIFMDLPWFFTPEGLIKNQLCQFDEKSFSRFGIMPKEAKSYEEIRWFTASPCYVFHISNAWETGDEVFLVACRFKKIEWNRKANSDEEPPRARLYEWRFNMKTGETQERELLYLPGEFPTINQDVVGRQSQFTYMPYNATQTKNEPGFGGLIKFNLFSGKLEKQYAWPETARGGEASFIPRPGAKQEDDGYLITFVHDEVANISSAYILDAREMTLQCRIELPHRVPYGFHGIYVTEDEIRSQELQ